MWTVAQERISKTYYANANSRSFLLSAACCVFATVVPALLLLAIGYSWNEFEVVQVQPQLTFQNHQVTCLKSDGTTTYDSSFTNEPSSVSYQGFVGMGGEGSSYAVSGTISTDSAVACSMLLYFNVALGNMQSVAALPLSFHSNDNGNSLNLASVAQSGTISVAPTSPLPQSSIVSRDWTNYHSNSSHILSMAPTLANYAAQKNLTLVPSLTTTSATYSSSASTIAYSAQLQVPPQHALAEVPLLTNLRSFTPYYIYLFVLFWAFLTQPTLRWILENKIYKSKVAHAKLKYH